MSFISSGMKRNDDEGKTLTERTQICTLLIVSRVNTNVHRANISSAIAHGRGDDIP